MSMLVLPTAPSPTVTHLMNLETVAAIELELVPTPQPQNKSNKLSQKVCFFG